MIAPYSVLVLSFLPDDDDGPPPPLLSQTSSSKLVQLRGRRNLLDDDVFFFFFLQTDDAREDIVLLSLFFVSLSPKGVKKSKARDAFFQLESFLGAQKRPLAPRLKVCCFFLYACVVYCVSRKIILKLKT